MLRSSTLVLLFTAALYVQALNGSTVYSTFGPGESYLTSTGWDVGSPAEGTYIAEGQLAMNFTPSSNYTLDSIDVAAGYQSGPNQMTVYLTSGALPGSPIESFNLTGLAPFSSGGSVLTVTSVLQPELLAGTQYWIVLTADDLIDTVDSAMQNNQGIMGFASLVNGLSGWTYGGGLTPAYDVNGSLVTPEPRSFWLLAFGLAAMALGARGGQFKDA